MLTSVPWVSSPLNSQKNAPPSPWVFTYPIFSVTIAGVSKLQKVVPL